MRPRQAAGGMAKQASCMSETLAAPRRRQATRWSSRLRTKTWSKRSRCRAQESYGTPTDRAYTRPPKPASSARTLGMK